MAKGIFRLTQYGRAVGVLGLLTSVIMLGGSPASAQTTAYQVTISTPAADPLVGGTFHITGQVSPSAAGPVRLQHRVGGRFTQVASQPLIVGSRYDFTLTLTSVGQYRYRVKKPATETLDAGLSATSTVFVTTRTAKRSGTRAQSWVDAHVPYSQSHSYTNRYGTYRQDCSGYVSMAWRLASSYTTGTLPDISHPITKSALHHGDLLLHAPSNGSGHVVLFDEWVDSTHASYIGYEESPSGGAMRHTIPYPYWDGNGTYTPYRRNAT
jgi:hypothetical protein